MAIDDERVPRGEMGRYKIVEIERSELTSDDRYNSQQTVHNQCHRLHGFICTFIGILISNLIIAYALIDTSVDFANVQK